MDKLASALAALQTKVQAMAGDSDGTASQNACHAERTKLGSASCLTNRAAWAACMFMADQTIWTTASVKAVVGGNVGRVALQSKLQPTAQIGSVSG